ncbi:MAG TPA: hypothetical protein PLO37_19795 [Candidatus Hydrogenedentes bacterium]|nr:hypothetical protein [Candidatus Hydrogenedentota bacterium]
MKIPSSSHPPFALALTIWLALGSVTAAETVTSESTPPLQERIWINLAVRDLPNDLWLDVDYPRDSKNCEPIEFSCTLHAEAPVSNVLVTLDIESAGGLRLYAGEAMLHPIEGACACTFVWDPSEAPDDTYMARFVWYDRPEFLCGRIEYQIRKTSVEAIEGDLAQAMDRARTIQSSLDDLAATGKRPAHLWVEWNVAMDFLAAAKAEHGEAHWEETERVLRGCETLLESVRSGLTFSAFRPELVECVGTPDLGRIELQGDSFRVNGEPVYLMGWSGDEGLADSIPRLAKIGLNAAVLRIPPAKTLPSVTDGADLAALYDGVFKAAAAHNVTIVVDLSPDELPGWATEASLSLIDEHLKCLDLTSPATRSLIERHLRAALPYVAGKPMVSGVCLLTNPRFRFRGEEVRQAFLKRVQELYPDRHALNRSWKAHLAAFEDIDISGNHARHEYQEKAAFQYDWQDFHRQEGTRFVEWLRGMAHDLAPGFSYHIRLADTVFDLGESRFGVDHEAVTATADLLGCAAATSSFNPLYGMDYPAQTVHHAFMASLAPHKALVNSCNHLECHADLSQSANAAFVHGATWDAFISGLDASFLDPAGVSAPQHPLSQPLTMAAYARACLDVNRLSRVVTAFQAAPADVAILWSYPAKVYQDGDPYLASTRDAFEGSSFSGYKVRFVTQKMCVDGDLEGVKVLVVPETPALTEEAFAALQHYVDHHGLIARLGTPIPYNERGYSRHDSIGTTPETILVRGVNLPAEYLHAMDAVFQFDRLDAIPRAVNAFQFPIEGVRTRYVEFEGEAYLFVINLRKNPVSCRLTGPRVSGRDLILGRDVVFPRVIDPLDPMLIRLDPAEEQSEVAADEKSVDKETVPVVDLVPVTSKHWGR